MTKFTRVEAQPETTNNTSNLMPYTNHIVLSAKVCEKPVEKVLNGFKTVVFPLAHWQPKNKPMFFATCIVYDEHVSQLAMKLQKGESILIEGKFGYDNHNGVAKHFILADSIKRNVSEETDNQSV